MSRTVFFGKIPYDYTEEQVLEVARSVGPVKEVRLVFDKETAKSKGFAFVEYIDKESAASAVRNLNNYQVGNQKLRVDFSNDGPNSHDNETPTQAIASLIDNMKSEERDLLLSEFKRFAAENHQNAVALLESNPQVAYALVQTMISQQKINHSQADSLLVSQLQPSTNEQTEKHHSHSNKPLAPVSTAMDTSSPAPMAAAVTPPPASKPIDEAQRQMIMQVMSLTPQHIEQLPADQRDQVNDLRARVERGEIVL